MKPSSPLAAVPSLRADLVISRPQPGVGAERVFVRPITDHRRTELRGFELSLARMLDGRRTAGQVLENAAHLGIPLTLPALEAFLAQLSGRGLLAEGPDEGVTPWAQRSAWDPLIRLQYQSALKAIRSGKIADARQRLGRLMQAAPAMAEPLALSAWLDAHPTGTTDGESFRETYLRTERGWFGWPDALDPVELDSVQASWTPMVVLIALLSVVLIGAFAPMPRVVSAPARLTPVNVSPVSAAHGGVIDQVLVAEGQWVKEGALLFTYGPPEGEAVVAHSEGEVIGLRARSSSPVFEGQQLLTLHDTRRLRITAQLDAAQALKVRAGQPVSVAVDGHRVRGHVSQVDQGQVVVVLENPSAAMEPGVAVLDIEVGWQSLMQRFERSTP